MITTSNCIETSSEETKDNSSISIDEASGSVITTTSNGTSTISKIVLDNNNAACGEEVEPSKILHHQVSVLDLEQVEEHGSGGRKGVE